MHFLKKNTLIKYSSKETSNKYWEHVDTRYKSNSLGVSVHIK